MALKRLQFTKIFTLKYSLNQHNFMHVHCTHGQGNNFSMLWLPSNQNICIPLASNLLITQHNHQNRPFYPKVWTAKPLKVRGRQRWEQNIILWGCHWSLLFAFSLVLLLIQKLFSKHFIHSNYKYCTSWKRWQCFIVMHLNNIIRSLWSKIKK